MGPGIGLEGVGEQITNPVSFLYHCCVIRGINIFSLMDGVFAQYQIFDFWYF